MTLKIPARYRGNRTVLIDGDILVYRCGFAAEKRCIDVYRIEDEQYIGSFETKEIARDYLDQEGIEEIDCLLLEDCIPEPVENCLHSTRLVINSIISDTDSRYYEVYITAPEGNFRDQVAVSKPYKGSRSGRKPYHYNDVRSYLKDYWSAIEVEGMEADDMLSIRQYQLDDSIIASLDKDLDMVPGLHYNFGGEEGYIYHINEIDGWRNFFKQMITGDTIDNIPGIPGSGARRASLLDDLYEIGEMYQFVKKDYERASLSDEYFDEQATLLWMKRSEEETWQDVKKTLEKG